MRLFELFHLFHFFTFIVLTMVPGSVFRNETLRNVWQFIARPWFVVMLAWATMQVGANYGYIIRFAG